MASLITCPHCGLRPREEFTIRGDAGPVRPAPDAPFSAWNAYVHLRDNHRGPMAEHWQHSGGCRRWLVVERDTFSHEVFSVVDAAEHTQARTRHAGKPGKVRKATKVPAPGKGRGGA